MDKLSGKEQDIVNLYISGKSLPQLAEIYGVKHQSIDKLLKKSGILKRSRKEALSIRYANHTMVSDSLMNKINGWLLGDGSLIWRGSAQAHFQHGSIHKEYAEYVKNCFEIEGLNCYFPTKEKCFYGLSTPKTIQFKELRDKRYPGGIKTVPRDLVITPDTMKFWIMDDGSLDKVDNIWSLHTNAFTIDECNFLIDRMRDCFGDIKARVVLIKDKYPKINISRLSVNKIVDAIGELEVGCFNYKFVKKVCKKDQKRRL